MPSPLHIAFVTSEMTPYASTGGLAEVAAALPKALGRLGHRVTVFLPRYGRVRFPAGEFVGQADVPVAGVRRVSFYGADPASNVRLVFVEHGPFFDRPQLYGEGRDYEDNRFRFALLSRAAIEYFRTRGERPDVFHAHDWQTGLVPVYLKSVYAQHPLLRRMPTVFTVHNLAYQGNFGAGTAVELGLPWHLETPEALEFHGAVSYLKGGVLFAEQVNTVSPQYAREIQGEEMGYGFDGILRAREGDLCGILNGVDYEEWDPDNDRFTEAAYTADDLSGKARCKADLQRSFSLPEDTDLPLVGVVSRLVHQKGFDIVARAWWDLLQRPFRMAVLGTGEPEVEAGFRSLAARAPDRYAVRFEYSPALAHKVMAGADMLLMPSRYEPCGLAQMYALRYGTVPVVRATGGLVDTVEPFQEASRQGTGFRFEHADGTGLMWALDEALEVWSRPDSWMQLRRNGMLRDFSWERSAQGYVELYRRAQDLV